MVERTCGACSAAMGEELRCRRCGAGDPRSSRARAADRTRQLMIALATAGVVALLVLVALLMLDVPD